MSGIIGRKSRHDADFSGEWSPGSRDSYKSWALCCNSAQNESKDGYDASKLDWLKQRDPRKLQKPLRGHFEKTAKGTPPTRLLKEFRVESAADFPIGSLVLANIFSSNELVTITGSQRDGGLPGLSSAMALVVGARHTVRCFTVHPAQLVPRLFPRGFSREAGWLGTWETETAQ
jgi:hypothetical protein